MKILILGAGTVGASVAAALATENSDITVVDIDQARLRELSEKLDIRTIQGHACLPSVLGYASTGLQTLVQNAGWLDYVALTASDVAPQRSSFGIGNFLAGTKLEVGRYLTSDLFVGYSQMLSTADLDFGMRMQWQFLPEYSFELFAEDRLARTPGFGVRPESGLKRVYGLLLFREWGF